MSEVAINIFGSGIDKFSLKNTGLNNERPHK